MTKENATVKGVEGAWDFWLSQHDITVPDCIIEAIQKSFANWLSDNEDKIIEAIAKQSKPT